MKALVTGSFGFIGSHVVKILQEMQKAGLLNFDKQGRLKLLTLTKKGQDIAERIDQIRNMM